MERMQRGVLAPCLSQRLNDVPLNWAGPAAAQTRTSLTRLGTEAAGPGVVTIAVFNERRLGRYSLTRSDGSAAPQPADAPRVWQWLLASMPLLALGFWRDIDAADLQPGLLLPAVPAMAATVEAAP